MPIQATEIKERLGTAAAYLTLGIWGFIWLLISQRDSYSQKTFIKFHCFQSIFIGILYMFVPQGIAILFSLITQIIGLIPGTTFITSPIHVIHGILQQIIHYGSLVLVIYCVIFCLLGKYTNIPLISQMINRMLR